MTVFQSDLAPPGIRRRDIFRGSAALATAPILGAPPVLHAASATRVLKLGYTLPRNSHYGAGAHAFSRQIEAASSGAWRIEQYPNGSLGSELETVADLRKGQLDLGIIYTGAFSGIVREFEVFDLPFLFQGPAQACAALDSAVGQEYLDKLRAYDIVGLAWGENGLRHITTSARPIMEPQDLRGLRFRVPQSEVVEQCFRQLGADAAKLSFPALYGALESGRFQGQENPIATIRAAHLERVQHHLTLSGHIYSSAIFVMSQDCWEDLTPHDRELFIEAARAGALESRRASRDGEQNGVRAMRSLGIEIVPNIDQEAFLAALEPTWSALALRFGKTRIEHLRAQS